MKRLHRFSSPARTAAPVDAPPPALQGTIPTVPHDELRAAPGAAREWTPATLIVQDDVVALIKAKARRLARSLEYRCDDLEDAAQDLALAALQVLQRYHGRPEDVLPYLQRALDNRGSNLRRRRRTGKRQPGRKVLSLSAPVRSGGKEGEPPLADVIRCHRGDQTRRWEIKQDVRTVLATLSPDEKQVVAALLEQTKAQVARQHNIPRTTFESRLRSLRGRFEVDPG